MYKHCPIVVALSGFVMLVIGILCTWYIFPKLVDWQINQAIEIREGTQAFAAWKKQPFPVNFKLYFFNVTNPSEVMKGEIPILNEVGPYIYDLYVERKVIETDEEADTIKYHMKKTYFFNAEASGCRSEYDMVTIINAALMGSILQVYSLFPSAISMVTEAYPYIYPGITDMFLRTSVRDLAFQGVTLHCTAPEIETMCQAMRAALPDTIKVAENDKDFIFSMFGSFNATLFGPFVMTRGVKNTTRGSLVAYMDEPELDVWADGICNMLNGSDSGLYFPMKKPVDKIYTFTPEICRSVGVNFDKKIIKNDISLYRYSVVEDTLSHKGADQCFCVEIDDDEFDCPADGLLSLQPCLKAPVLMSHPHFYLADKHLRDYAIGISPQKKFHESYLIIEPNTATPIEGAKRSQMNVEIRRFEEFPLVENMTEGIFPIVWLEESVTLPPELLTFLVASLNKIAILDVVKWILIVSGIALMLSSFVLVMYQERLMCFSSSGNLTINNARNVGNFNTVLSNLNFNASVVYPQTENKAFNDAVQRGHLNNSTEAWQFKP